MWRLRFTFALLLPLLVAVLSPSLVTATCNTAKLDKQTLETVLGYAQRHARAGTKETKFVLDRFPESTERQDAIACIYEEEFLRSLPWYGKLDRLGWVASVILLVLLFVKESLKSAVKEAGTKTGNAIYHHMSGTRPFRWFSLRRYRRALRRAHTEVKVPFRPGRPLRIGELFVPLRVAGAVTQEEVNADEAIRDIPRLMLKGPPGSGKSMLLRYAALCYAEERQYYGSGGTTRCCWNCTA